MGVVTNGRRYKGGMHLGCDTVGGDGEDISNKERREQRECC